VVIADWRAELDEAWAKLLTAAVDYLKAERGAQDVAVLAEFAEPLIEVALGQDKAVLEVAGSAHAEEMFVTSARAEVMEAIVRRLIG